MWSQPLSIFMFPSLLTAAHIIHDIPNKISRGRIWFLIDCNKALSINSNNKYAYDSRGDVRIKLGDKKGVCSDYKNAIANGFKPAETYLDSKEGAWCRNMPD